MSLRDLFRGFFGIPPPLEKPDLPGNRPGERSRENDQDSAEWKRVRPPPLDDYGDLISRRPEKVFSGVFSAVEEMMRDMEQSMKDFDRFFEDIGSVADEFGPNGAFVPRNIPLDMEDDAVGGCLPPLPRPPTKDANIRDLVLKKESEYPKLNAKDKVDKDLDEVYAKSGLDISQLPVPPKDEPAFVRELVPSSPPSKGGFSSSFERVYSTYSFNNGKWEGKTVRENNGGKEVTTYTRDENGQMNETTEYFPNTRDALPVPSHNQGPDRNPGQSDTSDQGQGYYSPFSIFDKLFKPKL